MSSISPYVLVLTHDIDQMSLVELPRRGRTFLGFFYRCLVDNLYRAAKGRIQFGDYLGSLAACLRTIPSAAGLGRDVWARSLEDMIALEDKLGVRSTLFFVTLPKEPGVLPGSLLPAPPNRAAFYRLCDHFSLLSSLVRGGWEVGVHGINAWRSEADARLELDALRSLVPDQQRIGIRMHWLYSMPGMWSHLEAAGFAYDTTLGWNDRVGFPQNKYHPFRPEGCRKLVVLPLNIQDGALLRDEYAGLTVKGAWRAISGILETAKAKSGVVTVLWHNTSFAPPRRWGGLYERLIKQSQDDGAEIMTAVQAVSTCCEGE